MTTQDYIGALPAGFGHWLAGFIDGEGCFKIVKGKPRRGNYRWRWSLEFTLALRDDDAAIAAREETKFLLGTIRCRLMS